MNDSQPLRLSILGIVAIALFTTLFSRLWFLQVMAAPEYNEQAVSNRTRTIVVEGPRGRIIDRSGRVLADNRESLVVTVDTNELEALEAEGRREEVLEALADELVRAGTEVTVEQIERRIESWRGDPFRPVVVAEDVNPDLWVTISERTAVLPGVGVAWHYVREYPYGDLAAHVLGYVGQITDVELRQNADAPKPYRGGDHIGKGGVEQIFEEDLRGTPGRLVFEVDSMGRVGRIVSQEEAVPGADVHLTIDIDIQSLVEVSLAEEMARARAPGRNHVPATAGSAVLADPRNGEVLAMASYPTFDPNELVRGVTTERYSQLGGEDCKQHFCPMSNRAIREPYAVGSTFKLISGYAAAASGLRDPAQWVDDNGSHTIRNCDGRCTFYNAGSVPHGSVNMHRALVVSSNVYFYSVGEDFWAQRNVYGETPIQDVASSFGMGERTGVALPLEVPGILSTPEMKRERHEANPESFPEGNWYIGDSVNLAIGQADIGVTPLQLANAYATFGNGGTRYAPNIARGVVDPVSGTTLRTFAPRVAANLDLVPSVWQTITDGLVAVTQNTQDGTAARVFDGFPHAEFPVAGKTGTAEVYNRTDSSLFAAWAPARDPRYAIAVVVEEGGFGSRVATPVARRVLEPLAERDLRGVPLVPAPRWGESVEYEVPQFEVGGALN